jgi:predicted nucleic acid-binding protein
VLVVDATVALAASGADDGFDVLGDDLIAPPLMWSEARSVLLEMTWRGEVRPEDAATTRGRLEQCRVTRRSPARLGDEAWWLAEELGWAKTYDAEYVALARLSHCRLVTLDARLRRATARLGFVVGPTEL